MSTDISQVVAQIKGMSRSDLEQFGTKLPQHIDPSNLTAFVNASLGSALNALPTDQKADAIKTAIQAQPEQEREKLARQVGTAALPPPTDHVRDKLWLIVVSGFSVVLVGSFVTLAFGVFKPSPGEVTPELILTMFTSVVGFLAGLFVPSPINNTGSSTG